MHVSRTVLLAGCVFLAILFGGQVSADDLTGKKVVVVSGVCKAKNDEAGHNLYQAGIKDGLNAVDITPVFQWAEMSYLPDDEAKSKAGEAAIAKAKAENPDLIVVLDDDALKFVGAKIDDIPVVFAYVFNSPSKMGMPKDNVTGIIRASYAVDNWRLAKTLFDAKTVGLVSKYSLPMEGVKRVLSARASMLEKDSGVLYKDMFMAETFEDWEKAIKEFPYDFIYLADTSRITRDGKEMTREEVTSWTVDNAKVPVIAAIESDVEAGCLYSVVTSEHHIGKMVAEEAIKILNGAAPDQVYKKGQKGKLVINLRTAQKYKLDIPYEIIETADRVIE